MGLGSGVLIPDRYSRGRLSHLATWRCYLGLLIKLFTLACLLAFTDLHAKTRLRTKRTPAHELIRDTKISIVPPPNFRLIANGMGFAENQSGASITAIRFEQPLLSAKKHLNEAYFRRKDYRIVQTKAYKINHLSACWYELENIFMDRTTIEYILILGNKNEYVMIEAYCPKEYPLAAIAVKQSNFSVYYDSGASQTRK